MKGAKKYADLDLTFIPNPKTGDLTPKYDEAAIQRAANHLIRLEEFDIPFAPHLKSGMRSYLFKTIDMLDEANIKKDVETVLKSLEPRIKVTGVKVDYSNPKQLIVTVAYSCLSINMDGEFNLIVEKIR